MISTNDLYLPVKYLWEATIVSYRGVIPCRQVLVMGTIVVSGGRGRKGAQKKAVTPKPQTPAVGESCIYTRLPSLAADCVKTWREHAIHITTPISAQSLALYQNQKALWLQHLQKAITVTSLRFIAITKQNAPQCCSSKICSRHFFFF